MQLIPYLFFAGQCREAFDFYARALGGAVTMRVTYGETQMREQTPPEARDWVMHSEIRAPGLILMGADGPNADVPPGAGTSVNVQAGTPAEAERVYAALLDGGTATMALQETFWAYRFGMLVDRYGKPWMVNCLREMPPV
ncbi:VOC family protein [Vulcaniibacterium tengchongense]|uniref:PhnB protein n=1 Tax=Vulcaniibacterium tengchongense TaxID=1273429 RepID=A0A3N4VAD7_9GAMM|nr:VOC family protein [Vulcaniibacterium tengchongense]RPE79966.1 PhnB protein [Vulcaniibacterium tengchongense]